MRVKISRIWSSLVFGGLRTTESADLPAHRPLESIISKLATSKFSFRDSLCTSAGCFQAHLSSNNYNVNMSLLTGN